MRRIILASRSKARQKLLRKAKLSFKAVVPNVKEALSSKAGVRKLVVANALKKAENIAKKFNSGIIIAADTVVLTGNKIIGKPRSKKEAFKILKYLSGRWQWVYTGLAVINIDNKKVFSGVEKTRIYLEPLTGRQIKQYAAVNKAGGFDIQGKGNRFITRIEGSYSNVVGLPLKKLAKLLRKAGVNIESSLFQL